MNNDSLQSPRLLLHPCLHHAADIRNDTVLAGRITEFINEGYRYLSPEDSLRWVRDEDKRLATPVSIHEELGQDGVFAVIYDPQNQLLPIACAAAKRWTGDLEGCQLDGEDGWEIKMVATRKEWMRQGLAVSCVNALVEELIRQPVDKEQGTGSRKVQIWVQAIECLNGVFWGRQGWVDVVRSYEKPVGHWGSKVGYRLLVLLREINVKSR